MRTNRLVPLLALPLLLAACNTGAIQPSAAPSAPPSSPPSAAPTDAPTEAPTDAPTDAPTTEPTAPPTEIPTGEPTAPPTVEPSTEPTNGTGELDPSLSDAGIVARVALSGDSRGSDRDGTYEVIAVDADGSGCSFTFDGDEYQAVAYDLTTDPDQVQRLSVTVPADAIPESDGDTSGVDGRVSFDFNAESFSGLTYTGDSSAEDGSSSTIDVNRSGETLTFTFDSTTWDDATFTGQLVCAAA